MSNIISKAAFTAKRLSEANGFGRQGLSHLSEILAALLGYRTLAAFKTEEADTSLTYHLEDAELIVLNQVQGEERAQTLGVDAGVVKLCADAIKSEAGVNVFDSVSDFYDSYAREELETGIAGDEATATAMAECNATFDGEIYLRDETPDTEDLWSSRDEWSIEASGTMVGSYDGDRMFNGSTLECSGRLVFLKAGRAGLVVDRLEAGAGVDDSWRDRDDFDYQGYLDHLASQG